MLAAFRSRDLDDGDMLRFMGRNGTELISTEINYNSHPDENRQLLSASP